ncbi:hypothetical protein [Nonlabens antarcticus]|uniref:hypothetical protein n=1 Tax=Nonlabens antarcticus TaxID=392714 RepID=UPI001890B9E6|nr:hypothetical protein [Nonlabens antarcticus]
MKNLLLKELIWFCGITVSILLFTQFYCGIDLFAQNETFDINIHDTYFVLEQLYAFLMVSIPLYSIIYLIRMILNRFENNVLTMVYLFFNSLFIILMGIIYALHINSPNLFSSSNPNTAGISDAAIVSIVLLVTILIALIILIYAAYRLVRNRNTA